MISVDGIELPNRPLSNFEIIDSVKKQRLPSFRGVFVRDALPRTPNNKSSAAAEMAIVATIEMGLKEGGAVPLSRSAGNPSNTMWPAVPSGVFIHPAVWPQ